MRILMPLFGSIWPIRLQPRIERDVLNLRCSPIGEVDERISS